MCRGAIVVICSDGLDRGDPGVLAEAMERLSRLCHKVIWMNPLKGDEEEFQPRSVGMLVAKPFVDELAILARRRRLDTREATTLLADAESALDRLLVALMVGHGAGVKRGE